jgi:hypothetical protein
MINVYSSVFEIKKDNFEENSNVDKNNIKLDVNAIVKDDDIILNCSSSFFSEEIYFVIPLSIPAADSVVKVDKVFFKLLKIANPEGPEYIATNLVIIIPDKIFMAVENPDKLIFL